MAGSVFGNRIKPKTFVGIVLMGKDRNDLKAVSQQGINADAANIVIA